MAVTAAAGGQEDPDPESEEEGQVGVVGLGAAVLEPVAQEADKTTPAAATATAEAGEPGTFASFPGSSGSPEPPSSERATVFDDAEFVWSEPAAGSPPTPLAAVAGGDGGGGTGDNALQNKLDGDVGDTWVPGAGGCGSGSGGVGDSAAGGAGGEEAGGDENGSDWSDDPFDSFQSAPLASSSSPHAPPPLASLPPPSQAASSPPAIAPASGDEASSPSPLMETSSWNLDFLMAAPAAAVSGGGSGSGGEGRLSPTPGGVGLGAPVLTEEGQPGKPLDLVRCERLCVTVRWCCVPCVHYTIPASVYLVLALFLHEGLVRTP